MKTKTKKQSVVIYEDWITTMSLLSKEEILEFLNYSLDVMKGNETKTPTTAGVMVLTKMAEDDLVNNKSKREARVERMLNASKSNPKTSLILDKKDPALDPVLGPALGPALGWGDGNGDGDVNVDVDGNDDGNDNGGETEEMIMGRKPDNVSVGVWRRRNNLPPLSASKPSKPKSNTEITPKDILAKLQSL